MDYDENDRVDGRALSALREPGSDDRLSHEAKAKIKRAILEDDPDTYTLETEHDD